MNRLKSVVLSMLLSMGVYAQQDSPGSNDQWPACGIVESFPGSEWALDSQAAESWRSMEQTTALFKQLKSKALMVVHKGRLVFSEGPVEKRYMLASLRKSVLNAMYGAYAVNHPINMDASLAELGINDSQPALNELEQQATIRDLMLARSGIFHSAHYEPGMWQKSKRRSAEWAQHTFGRSSAPHGRMWMYNNWDFNVLGSIYELLSGERMGPSFARLLSEPLEMQDYRAEDVSYVGNESYAERRQGNLSDHPAYMFHMSTRDLARLGVLFLNCGQWKQQQLIKREWVHESIRGIPILQGAPEESPIHKWYGDYGWLWWVDKPGQRRTFWKLKTTQPVYFGQGARGHYIWVAPYLDLVVVHQVATAGGLGTWSQLRRRFLGSPKVSDQQFQELLRLIIMAHPDSETALFPEDNS